MFICKYCKKPEAVKAGLRKNKNSFVQKYECKFCGRQFINRKGFERMRIKPEIIVDALDLRSKGLSLGKIRNFILQKYDVKVTRATILNWQKKFGESINKFTKQFVLPYSYNLHADEVFFHAKGW